MIQKVHGHLTAQIEGSSDKAELATPYLPCRHSVIRCHQEQLILVFAFSVNRVSNQNGSILGKAVVQCTDHLENS